MFLLFHLFSSCLFHEPSGQKNLNKSWFPHNRRRNTKSPLDVFIFQLNLLNRSAHSLQDGYLLPSVLCPSKQLCPQDTTLLSPSINLSQACSAFFKGLLCLRLHLFRHKTELKLHSAGGHDNNYDAYSFNVLVCA